MSSIPIDPAYLAQLKRATPANQADKPVVVKTTVGHKIGDNEFVSMGDDLLVVAASDAQRIPNAPFVSQFVAAPAVPAAPITIRDELKLIKPSAGDIAKIVTPTEQGLRLSQGTVHEIRGFKGHALRMYRFGGKSCPITEGAIGTASYKNLKELLSVPNADVIDLQYLKLTPDLVKSMSFRTVAQVLKQHRTKISYHLDPDSELNAERSAKGGLFRTTAEFLENFWKGVHDKAVHAHHDVSGLTAAFLTMKIWGDLEAMARVFQRNPQEIAAEIRKEKLGNVLGSHATKYLLHCIMSTVKTNSHRESTHIYLRAATDLLVAALQRYDRKDSIHQTGQMADSILRYLDQFCVESPTIEAHAFKCAVKYEALFAHATSVDTLKAEHRNFILAVLGGGISTVATTGGLLTSPAGVGNIVNTGIQSLGTIVLKPIGDHMDKKMEAGKLLNDGEAHFNIDVIGKANDGQISGYSGEVTPFIAQTFAKRAVYLLESVAKADGLKVELQKPQSAAS